MGAEALDRHVASLLAMTAGLDQMSDRATKESLGVVAFHGGKDNQAGMQFDARSEPAEIFGVLSDDDAILADRDPRVQAYGIYTSRFSSSFEPSRASFSAKRGRWPHRASKDARLSTGYGAGWGAESRDGSTKARDYGASLVNP